MSAKVCGFFFFCWSVKDPLIPSFWSKLRIVVLKQVNRMSPLPSSLHGVEVCGQTVLEVVGNKSQKLEWPGYRFYLEVPDGALPPRVTSSIAVKAILTELPEDSKLISAIYWISASEVFLKEVAVNIQHCAVIRSEEEFSKFRFIIKVQVHQSSGSSSLKTSMLSVTTALP